MEMVLNHSNKIMAIHITDRKLYNNYGMTIKFQLSLNPRHFKNWDQFLKDTLYLCDLLSKLRVKPKV